MKRICKGHPMGWMVSLGCAGMLLAVQTTIVAAQQTVPANAVPAASAAEARTQGPQEALPVSSASVQPAAPDSAHSQKAEIVYTGSTNGLLQPKQDRGNRVLTELQSIPKQSGVVVVGMGDNFAIDATPSGVPRIDRTNPNPALNPAVEFFSSGRYDALVPGAEDFFFGVEFLRRASQLLPLVASNLTVTVTNAEPCKAAPTPTAAAWILPNQVSSSLSGGSSGGGKGGKGGGGGGASAGGVSAGGSSGGGGGGSAASCTPEAPKKQKMAKGMTEGAQPKLAWPDSGSIYPWTTAFSISNAPAFDSKRPEVVSLCWQTHASEPDDPTFAGKDDAVVYDQYLNCTPLKRTPPTGNVYALMNPDAFPIIWSAQADTVEQSATEAVSHPRPLRSAVEEIRARPPVPPALSPVKHPLAKLFPGVTVGLCMEIPGRDKTATMPAIPDQIGCTPLTVKRPLIERPWIRVEPTSDLADGASATRYVIFGAMAPNDTLTGVADADLQWLGEDGHPTMTAGVEDPGSAVLQAVRAYNVLRTAQNPIYHDGMTCGDDSFAVLLAQMTPGNAKTLASYLSSHVPAGTPTANDTKCPSNAHVDVILSAADEYDASESLTIDVKPEDAGYIPVITPRPLMVHPKKNSVAAGDVALIDPLQQLSIDRTSAAGSFSMKYHNRPDPGDVALQQACTLVTLPKPAATQLPYCSANTPFQCAVLGEMQDQLHADVAVVEEKSFYTGCSYNPAYHPGETDTPGETLWASGHLTRVALLGSTLKTILQASQKTAGRSSLQNADLESGQVLATVGIEVESPGIYRVNGMPLNASAIYTVATSDRLTGSNSDYPQVAQADLGPPEVFWGPTNKNTGPTTEEIASLGDAAFRDIQTNPPTRSTLTVVLRNHSLVAESTVIPALGGVLAPAPTAKQSESPAFTSSTRDNPPLKGNEEISKINPEYRPYLNLVLQQASFGYSLSRPNQTDANINTNLSGVTNPNVASPYSDSLSATDNFRFDCYTNESGTGQRRKPCALWTLEGNNTGRFPIGIENMGFDEQANLVRNRQGSLSYQPAVTPTGDSISEQSVSYSGNSLTVSPFLEFQMKRWPVWKVLEVRPLLFTTNLATLPEILATAGKAPNGDKIDYEFSVARTRSWAPISVGTRWEANDFRYFELGFTDQISSNVLSGLTLNGTLYSLTASNTASSVAQKITPVANDVAIPSYSTYHQKGAYWLGMFTSGIPKIRTTYQFTGFGDFFAYGHASASSVLTHYAAQMIHTLQFPLWANFSIGPSYSVFFFQDSETHAVGTSLIRQTVSFQLNYNFSWHQGMPDAAFLGKPN